MKYIDQIIQISKKPFPDFESRSSYFKQIIALSLFVTFFLYIFKPFGIASLESNSFLICLGFGSMTLAGAIVYDVTIGQLIKATGFRQKWTFGKWIMNTLGYVLFISMANFIFARLVLFGYIQWDLFPVMLYSTFMIGIIPVVALGAISLFSQERKYHNIAQEINLTKPNLKSGGQIEDVILFGIPASQIKYIEALQNYVNIGYLDTDGNMKVKTERSTLKVVSSAAIGTSIIKCHRSYLVNKDVVVSASGNAQGLQLSISDSDKLIPVSRSCVPLFRE